MSKVIISVVALIFTFQSTVATTAESPTTAPSSEELLSRPNVQGALSALDAWIDGVRIYDQVPGISVGVVYNQDLIWSKGFGYANLSSNLPVDSDTLYSVCSISKIFTAIGVMQLRDQGHFELRDSIRDYLSWFDLKQQYEQSGPITIESILTHSSGLPREASFDYWYNDLDFPTRDELVSTVGTQETLYPAQSYFQYSNLGFTLAGELIQAIANQGYSEYMQENVIGPMGLTDTRTYYPVELRGTRLAIGYDGIVRNFSREPTAPFFTNAITPAAGYTSSVNDLAKFIIWQFGLLDAGQETILSPHTLREMQRVHWVNPDWATTWGLGFRVRREGDRTQVGHVGSCPGYQTFFSMDVDKRFGVVVLTNAGDGQPERIAKSIFNTLLPELEKPESDNDANAIDLTAYEGNFPHQHWGGETAIRQWGEELVTIRIPSQVLSTNKLKHEGDNVFYQENDAGLKTRTFTFELDANGSARKVKINDSHRERID